jgi:hypothetical protein
MTERLSRSRPLRTVAVLTSTLAVVLTAQVAPASVAAEPTAGSSTTAAVPGVTVRMPAAVARALDAAGSTSAPGSRSVVDAVATDALGRSAAARGKNPAAAVEALAAVGREVVVDVRSAASGWARGVAYVEAPAVERAYPEGWLFLARYTADGWVVGLEGDDEFASHVATSPLVGTAERRTMTAYAQRRVDLSTPAGTVSPTVANTGGLLLPWMPDYYMTITGGPHPWGSTGYWSSLDFSGGNASGRVRSSREGTATSLCGAGGGWTRVIHPNGFSTDYYHMYNAVYYNGTAVGSSALLGTIGNDLCAGGSTSGAHVHWGLRTYDANYNGQYTWLHGRTIGGWTWWNGAQAYQGSATRNGVTAYVGTAIYNRHS